MHNEETNQSIETFCERQGFVFHGRGRGRYGIYPYWTWQDSIEYMPQTGHLKITARCGTYTGTVESVEHFLALLKAMQIDPAEINNPEQAHKNSYLKMERKMELANRIASRIRLRYGFRPEKCLHMAMQGDWWHATNHLSQMTLKLVDRAAEAVIRDVESNKIM